MRKSPVGPLSALRAPWLVLLCLLAFALPIAAQEDWGTWEDEGGGDGGGGFGAYASDVGNRASMGANSLLTFLADPVMSTVKPRAEFDKLPATPVSPYVVGLLQGTLLGAYRATMGTLDLAFSWLTPMRMLSPEPRYNITGAEHDRY